MLHATFVDVPLAMQFVEVRTPLRLHGVIVPIDPAVMWRLLENTVALLGAHRSFWPPLADMVARLFVMIYDFNAFPYRS